jgi:hypothetical protein
VQAGGRACGRCAPSGGHRGGRGGPRREAGRRGGCSGWCTAALARLGKTGGPAQRAAGAKGPFKGGSAAPGAGARLSGAAGRAPPGRAARRARAGGARGVWGRTRGAKRQLHRPRGAREQRPANERMPRAGGWGPAAARPAAGRLRRGAHERCAGAARKNVRQALGGGAARGRPHGPGQGSMPPWGKGRVLGGVPRRKDSASRARARHALPSPRRGAAAASHSTPPTSCSARPAVNDASRLSVER